MIFCYISNRGSDLAIRSLLDMIFQYFYGIFSGNSHQLDCYIIAIKQMWRPSPVGQRVRPGTWGSHNYEFVVRAVLLPNFNVADIWLVMPRHLEIRQRVNT